MNGAGPRAGETRLRALVVDDEKLARDELCYQLGQDEDVELIGQAANGVEAHANQAEDQPTQRAQESKDEPGNHRTRNSLSRLRVLLRVARLPVGLLRVLLAVLLLVVPLLVLALPLLLAAVLWRIARHTLPFLKCGRECNSWPGAA
jgi:hypothetical protein